MKKFIITFALLFLSALTFCQNKAIRVVVIGKGSLVLFLPGFTSPGSVFNETMRNLKADKECHIISYAGFNGIPPVDTPWYNAIKEELLHYIEEENLSKLTIIGHSMGGILAVDIAAALPAKVNKLILVDAIPCMRALMMPGVTVAQIQYNAPYNDQLLKMSDDAFRETAGMMAKNLTMNETKIDTLTNWIIEADRKTYVYGYTDLLKLDLRDILKQVKAKTLILGASYPNIAVVKGTFEQQYANLSAKTIEIARDSKHFIMFDQPKWFYNKVNTFLEK